MYALFQSEIQWSHRDVTGQTVCLLCFKCVLARIAFMVMVSVLKPD
jgi:hypothetical protein